MFLILGSINWQNFIVWLPLRLETLGNICIVIVSFPGCDVIKYTIHLNGFNKLNEPIIWIWTAVYTYQINWKNAANFCQCASEIFASYLWRRFLVKLTKLNCFIIIFKGFAKYGSYLALRFSKLGTTFFMKYFLPIGHTTSLQWHKTSIRRQGSV